MMLEEEEVSTNSTKNILDKSCHDHLISAGVCILLKESFKGERIFERNQANNAGGQTSLQLATGRLRDLALAGAL
jgi:hypothetical protein